MPRSWLGDWPLMSGAFGKPLSSWTDVVTENEDYKESRRRDELVETMGNLTVITMSLNSAMSNSPWSKKKPQLQAHSLMPINLSVQIEEIWDEGTIVQRGRDLFERAVALWPRPTSG